jgi:serine phosphatase RsbU (regulator of sigma subunit)/anti-sigma regulatory factor (Ser/Thr protein kinase)/ABC-type transporter Mla MlaB component
MRWRGSARPAGIPGERSAGRRGGLLGVPLPGNRDVMTRSEVEGAGAVSEDYPVVGDPEQVASAVEQAPFMFVVCEGPQLRLVAANATARAMVPGREALGRPLREAFAELEGQYWIEQYERAYEAGEPIGGREWRAQLAQADGSIREVYATFTLTPWRDGAGRVRGVIGAGTDVTEMVRARMTKEDDLYALQQRYARGREVVEFIQRELLPVGLPVLPGFRVGGAYLPADADASAGGDWLDSVVLPDGRLALIVGDVVGNGIPAAATMGQLRAVLHERLAAGASVTEALTALDRLAVRLPGGHAATACIAVLDPTSGSATYCTAGHPPPLLVSHGRPRYLPVSGAGPLGTGSTFLAATAHLDEDDLLLLYSDGILERPGITTSTAAVELARVAADTASREVLPEPTALPVERACAQTVELLVRTTGHRDDVTLLAAQRVAAVPDLWLRMPAALSTMPKSRAALADWLVQVGASDDDRFALMHGVGELVANAIEHGRPAGWDDDAMTLHATLNAAGQVIAVVTDRGSWQDSTHENERGRGLALATELVDDVRVDSGAEGTTATIRHRLTRPPRLLSPDRISVPATPDPASDEPGRLLLTEAGDASGAGVPRVRVDGPIDAATAPTLRRELTQRARGGVRAVTVDLTGATHLASAGVSVLHEIVAKLRTITLYATVGSPAQQIMAMVALPHMTDASAEAGQPAP